jgi:Leucine-rich repeat (LRR) protein
MKKLLLYNLVLFLSISFSACSDNGCCADGDENSSVSQDENVTTPPEDVNTTPPADVNTTPPADVNTTPPADVNTTPPADVNTTPPADVNTTPPEDVNTTPPADVNTTPPEDVNTTPPEDVNTTPPEDVNTTPPADVNTTPPEITDNDIVLLKYLYISGVAVDGYIKDGNISISEKGSGEILHSTKTLSDGNWSVLIEKNSTTANEFSLEVSGGIDIGTGEKFEGTLGVSLDLNDFIELNISENEISNYNFRSVKSNRVVASPITNLLKKMMENNLTRDEAEEKLATTLRVSKEKLKEDPIANSSSENESDRNESTELYKNAIAIQKFAEIMTKSVVGDEQNESEEEDNETLSFNEVFSLVISSVAEKVDDNNESKDIGEILTESTDEIALKSAEKVEEKTQEKRKTVDLREKMLRFAKMLVRLRAASRVTRKVVVLIKKVKVKEIDSFSKATEVITVKVEEKVSNIAKDPVDGIENIDIDNLSGSEDELEKLSSDLGADSETVADAVLTMGGVDAIQKEVDKAISSLDENKTIDTSSFASILSDEVVVKNVEIYKVLIENNISEESILEASTRSVNSEENSTLIEFIKEVETEQGIDTAKLDTIEEQVTTLENEAKVVLEESAKKAEEEATIDKIEVVIVENPDGNRTETNTTENPVEEPVYVAPIRKYYAGRWWTLSEYNQLQELLKETPPAVEESSQTENIFDIFPTIENRPSIPDVDYSKFLHLEIDYSRSGESVTNIDNNLRWEDGETIFRGTLSEAKGYCETLSLDGVTDWRVPTYKELFYLVDRGEVPTIDSNFQTKDENSYWTTDKLNGDIFSISFSDGSTNLVSENSISSVRCISGVSLYESIDFSRDEIVKDSVHNLFWIDEVNSSSVTLEGGYNFCKNLSFAGYSDWRLPTVEELVSILDLTREDSPSINPIFQNRESGKYWSNSTSPNGVWLLDLNSGKVEENSTNSNFTTCVRAYFDENSTANLVEDSNLMECINSELDQNSYYSPLESEILEITSLDCSSREIETISGVETLENLVSLNLEENSISDLSPFSGESETGVLSRTLYRSTSGLSKLSSLELRNNRIEDISPLSQLSELRELGLENNDITDLSPLSENSKLSSIKLGGNSRLSDLSPLSDLNITSISLSDTNLTTLSAISVITTLESLNLENRNIEDISSLSNLLNLQSLYLDKNSITDLSPLSNLTKLKYLFINENGVEDISALSSLVNLTYLSLNSNGVKDISVLANFIDLKALYLNKNSISDISSLSNLTQLETLHLGTNSISDISAISNLENLSILQIEDNSISDISPLSNLKNLGGLNIHTNLISDISPILGLTGLGYLSIFNNYIPSSEKSVLEGNLSNTTIFFETQN